MYDGRELHGIISKHEIATEQNLQKQLGSSSCHAYSLHVGRDILAGNSFVDAATSLITQQHGNFLACLIAVMQHPIFGKDSSN